MSGITEMLGRFGWQLRPTDRPRNASRCKRCDQDILWVWRLTRLTPLDPNGRVHPWDCSVP